MPLGPVHFLVGYNLVPNLQCILGGALGRRMAYLRNTDCICLEISIQSSTFEITSTLDYRIVCH